MCLYKLWMVYYDRIDFFEGTDVNKTNKSKECDNYHYWNFLDKGFNFKPLSKTFIYVCNGSCD